jgi:hypothetical protein
MANCETCGSPLTPEERARNPRSYIDTKPDGSQNKYSKDHCHGCNVKELEKKGVVEDHG